VPDLRKRYIPQVVRREVDPVGWLFYRENFHDMVQELFSTIDRSTNGPFWKGIRVGMLLIQSYAEQIFINRL
jgi:hypothetical protein